MKEEYTGQLQPDEVRADLAEFWSELDREGAMRNAAKASGIDLQALAGIDRAAAIQVGDGKAGLDEHAVNLIIEVGTTTLAPVVAKLVWSLWTDVFLPRLQTKHGKRGIRPKQPSK